MAIIPVINKDHEEVVASIKERIAEPNTQRKIVLVIVCIALLLDNMLYMVIVPIIPDYLDSIHAFERAIHINSCKNLTNHSRGCKDEIRWLVTGTENAQIGLLFASKAIVQLIINPVSGTIIDRIGYDIPMMIGLIVIFISTIVFAYGTTYQVMFIARSLQGVGSAFADTSGFAMIADRFTEEVERSKALGIALAFISFGCLVAPPFGGIMYTLSGSKSFPFICLALIALADGFLLITILKPERLQRRQLQAEGKIQKGTPIYILLMDPYIAICAGALAMSNVSLAFLEPTIAKWMEDTMHVTNWQMGLVWLPAFFPHVLGVYATVKLAATYPNFQWLIAAIGLGIEGVSCLFIPLCTNFITLMFPISTICFGIALVDTAILPTMGYLVDTRHVPIYGSIYAIGDIFYSLAYAIGPIVAGGLVTYIKFTGLNIAIFVSNILFVPVIFYLKNIYKYREFENTEGQQTGNEDASDKDPNQYRSYMVNGSQLESKGSLDVNGGGALLSSEKDGLVTQPSDTIQSGTQRQQPTMPVRPPLASHVGQQQYSGGNYANQGGYGGMERRDRQPEEILQDGYGY